jgi:ATP-dependent helicase/nuclease subunit A
LADGRKTDQTAATAIAEFLALDIEGRVARFATYRNAFLTQKGEPRSGLPTKAILEASPETASTVAAEQRRLTDILDRLKAAEVMERTAAVLRLGHAVLERFRDNKARRALLDYDDLINQTNALLAQPAITPWVLYKLDGGIDHVMVDEAQDTSPAQWRIVLQIVREFFEGEADDALPRTVFVVGDEKQSIFSFQGADLEALRNVHGELYDLAHDNERRWFQSGLNKSFRSVSAVLKSVDGVFAKPDAKPGVVDPGTTLEHQVQRIGQGGLVELWPVVTEPEEEAFDPWQAPLAYRAPQDRSTRLAREIASTIDSWIVGEQQLVSKGRKISEGDIMVLVPRRTRFVHALVHELKARGRSVAGVDRMDLTGQIAVRDLMALGYACLMPDDDVALAAVLKGPLVDFDDDQLYDLARRRQGWSRDGRGTDPVESLWAALARRANDDPGYRAAYDWFAAQLGHADLERPFEFYCRVLSETCPAPRGEMTGRRFSGREAMLRRLGIEAEDPLDEFLAAALDYEREHTASLQGLLAWLETGSAEIKREMEARQDMVRIMTVHGAKGLQAPIVFLADDMAARPPGGDNLVWLANDLPLWPGSADKRDSLSDELVEERRERQAEERRRLLYVALTRAEDRLYVTAASANPDLPPESWHALVRAGLADIAEPFAFEASGDPAWTGDGLRYAVPQTASVAEAERAAEERSLPALDADLLAPAAVERDTDRPLNPSRLGGKERAPDSPLAGDGKAAERGQVIHRLLELLPDLPATDRPGAAARLLDHLAREWTGEERAGVANDVLAILEDETFAGLFSADSRAEVPIIGRLGDKVIAGQVDRLAIGPKTVDIVDFKSNRQPPETPEAIPEAYLRQMAAYRAVLQQIYPQHEVRCLLLWTAKPALQPVPQGLLDAYAP